MLRWFLFSILLGKVWLTYFIPVTLILESSADNAVSGSFLLNVTHFSEKPLLFNTNSSWSALSRALLITWQTVINIYIILSNIIYFWISISWYPCCLTQSSVTDFCLILHNKSMSLSLSHLVPSFCPSHCAIYIAESTNAPILTEQNYTSFYVSVEPNSWLYHW